MLTRPAMFLHLEGATLLVLSVLLYSFWGVGWGRFALLFMAPDVFMLGYLGSPRWGAAVYNLGHTLLTPLLLAGGLLLSGQGEWLPYALIWTAHIGMDRMLGFGLKYPTRFQDTHMQRVKS